MAKPYSMDLRDRVVDGVAAGQSAQAVAKIFSIGLSTVLRWSRRVQATGSVAPGQMGGHRKPKLLACAAIVSTGRLLLQEWPRMSAGQNAKPTGSVPCLCERYGPFASYKRA